MLGPVLGTIADYKGCKKRFFAFFLLIGVAGTAALALIPGESWMLLLICYTISTIGFAGSNVFYDAFLVDVAAKERMNMVSARGFGLGYIGSTIPFLLSIAVILSAQAEVIPLSAQVAGRIAFLITAAWWGAVFDPAPSPRPPALLYREGAAACNQQF